MANRALALRPDADLDDFLKKFGLEPHRLYRRALKGFAALLGSALIAQLKLGNRVLAVESDGEIIPCAQTVPAGILRIGITNFPVAHIDGGDHRINVDVAVLDTGIQTNHPDLNVVHSVDCTGEDLNAVDSRSVKFYRAAVTFGWSLEAIPR